MINALSRIVSLSDFRISLLVRSVAPRPAPCSIFRNATIASTLIINGYYVQKEESVN